MATGTRAVRSPGRVQRLGTLSLDPCLNQRFDHSDAPLAHASLQASDKGVLSARLRHLADHSDGEEALDHTPFALSAGRHQIGLGD